MAPPSLGDPGGDLPTPPPSHERSGNGSPDWDRVRDLFHEALGLEPSARGPFLSKIAEEDPALAGEVRSLLSAHEESSGLLDASPVSPFIRTASSGDRLGPYRIIEEIGRGGMGVVYRASRDDDSFTKQVAIKLIDPFMRSDEVMKRFRAERQILAMLDHAHIARLLDGGTARDGSPYLVMEHVSAAPSWSTATSIGWAWRNGSPSSWPYATRCSSLTSASSSIAT